MQRRSNSHFVKFEIIKVSVKQLQYARNEIARFYASYFLIYLFIYLFTLTGNTFCRTRYLPHCPITVTSLAKILQPLLVLNKHSSLKLSPFATSDMIGHVTIGFVIYGFQLVVNFNQPPFSQFLRY